MAGAMPLTGVETHVMGVVVATEGERESVDRDAIELTRVAIRLLDFADQGTVHRGSTSVAPGGDSQAAPGRCTIRPVERSCAVTIHPVAPPVIPRFTHRRRDLRPSRRLGCGGPLAPE